MYVKQKNTFRDGGSIATLETTQNMCSGWMDVWMVRPIPLTLLKTGRAPAVLKRWDDLTVGLRIM